ncbi:protein FAM185A-like [Gigantopelta aegis]|uniref:protein FAM185A-like n=1 Tax=Gigantopelta aegis TaxID=1735272 RepID=UPI001B88D87B|nr:protein FAM185A-like [Gigantopelta aegis]
MSTFRYLCSKQLTELLNKITYQRFMSVRRFVKLVASKQCWPKQKNPPAESLLESWYYEVDPFGLLKIKVPFNIQVKSLNPETHPKMNRVIVQIISVSVGDQAVEKPMVLPLMYDLKTQVNHVANEIEVTATVQRGVTLPIECIVQAPIKMNLNIESDNGSIAVMGFENDHVDVNLHQGQCILNNIKSKKVNIVNNGGNIVSNDVLQASIDLQTKGKGDIKGARLQGTSVQCRTEEGDINIQDLYAETSRIETVCGSIKLGSCHGNTSISIGHGSLKIASVDGNLDAHVTEGQTDVYIVRHEDVRITCNKGDITLKYSDTTESQLELLADDVSFDQQMKATLKETHLEKGISYKGFINKESDKHIKVSTYQGKISLMLHDWLASIGLKQTSPRT